MKRSFRFFILPILYCILVFFASTASAQNVSIIRDSETENFLYDLTKPILIAAGLDYKNIKIYIVQDNSINAFVAGGQNVFVNTGLINKYDQPDVLMGVLAHESGHIAAGHLARSSEELSNINRAMILTYLAGFAAALSSSPDAGYALIMGGNQIGERLALKYTRGQEESADRLAMNYLAKINYPADGLLELLEYFDSEMIGLGNLVDEFALTHPVSKKRINFIKANLPPNQHYNEISASFTRRLERINVKIEAFLRDPDQIIQKYSNPNITSQLCIYRRRAENLALASSQICRKNTDFLINYALSIAYFKKGKIDQSLQILDRLITNYPNDSYLWELKGQILFESGAIAKSVIAYKTALKLQPQQNALFKIAFATAIISYSNDAELNNLAIDNLEQALLDEPENVTIFKQLALGYDKIGDKGRSYLALAELNLLRKDKTKVREYIKLAKEKLDKNDKPALIRAEDILNAINEKEEEKKQNKMRVLKS